MSTTFQPAYTTSINNNNSNNHSYQPTLQMDSSTSPATVQKYSQENRCLNLHTGQIISLLLSIVWYIIAISITLSLNEAIPNKAFAFLLMIFYLGIIYYPLTIISTAIIAIIRCIQYPKWNPASNQNVTKSEAKRSKIYHLVMLILHSIFTTICLIFCLIATPIVTTPTTTYTPGTKGPVVLVLFYILIGFFTLTTILQGFIFRDAQKRLEIIQSSTLSSSDEHHIELQGDEQG